MPFSELSNCYLYFNEKKNQVKDDLKNIATFKYVQFELFI